MRYYGHIVQLQYIVNSWDHLVCSFWRWSDCHLHEAIRWLDSYGGGNGGKEGGKDANKEGKGKDGRDGKDDNVVAA